MSFNCSGPLKATVYLNGKSIREISEQGSYNFVLDRLQAGANSLKIEILANPADKSFDKEKFANGELPAKYAYSLYEWPKGVKTTIDDFDKYEILSDKDKASFIQLKEITLGNAPLIIEAKFEAK